MTAQEKIQKVTEISQSKGWSISVDDKNKSNIQFDFQRYTNYGQDFNFSAEMKCEDIDTLIADMEQYFEGFDPDYEAYLWIGNDGHGKNGAPYHIKDIVSDGRILGKMAHSERRGDGVAVNIYGEQDIKIFESGVEYFK